MTECLRGDGVTRSAAGGMIIVIREADERGTCAHHLVLARTCLSLLCLLFNLLEMVHLYFPNTALHFLPSAQGWTGSSAARSGFASGDLASCPSRFMLDEKCTG